MKKMIFYCLAILFVFTVSATLNSQTQPGTQQEVKEESNSDGPGKAKPWYESENLRAIVGFEQTGASSAQSRQFFFTDLYFSHPFPLQPGKGTGDEILGPRLRMWGNVRITSVPQQVKSNVGKFAANFYEQVGKLKVNEVAQAVDFLIGLDYRLLDFKSSSGNFCYSLNLIAGFGAITPFAPKDYMEVYQVTPDLVDLYKKDGYDFTDKTIAAIANPGRNRFFRQYHGGIRFKSYSNPDSINGRSQFPSILDITYGINESITSGRRDKGVFMINFFYPLNITGNLNIYLFGNAQLLPTKTITAPPVFLASAPANTDLNSGNVIIITAHPVPSEYYRIGIGVDLAGLFTPKSGS